MTDPHTAASWHYQNAKRHAHKTGIGMTIRERPMDDRTVPTVALTVALITVVAILWIT